MDQRTQSRRNAPRPNPAGITLISAAILGICLIIAGASISGSVKKLTAAVEAQTFASTYSSPSTITVNSSESKNYFTEKEAAAYLNITEDEVKAAITKGEIGEYIKTSAGYSISRNALDKYFDNRAYDLQLQNNSDD